MYTKTQMKSKPSSSPEFHGKKTKTFASEVIKNEDLGLSIHQRLQSSTSRYRARKTNWTFTAKTGIIYM